jgi:hypothetical protein
MLPLTLGRLLHEERQRQIESDLERRRLLAPSDPDDEPQAPARPQPAKPARAVRLAQDSAGDPICRAS